MLRGVRVRALVQVCTHLHVVRAKLCELRGPLARVRREAPKERSCDGAKRRRSVATKERSDVQNVTSRQLQKGESQPGLKKYG